VAALLWVLACAFGAVLGWVVALAVHRLRRLARLHARLDAARAGLLAALEQRAEVAGRVAADLGGRAGVQLSDAAAAARGAGTDWPDREAAENRLGRRLAALDRASLPAPLADDLVDAELGLVLARRVHNDAVRDTAGLRSRWLVRWLRLAGRAPLPRYFEIADPPAEVTGTAARPANWS
jgi:hypothetical protein